MPEPSAGQPFNDYPGTRISVGDLKAPYGSDAAKGVIILEGGPHPIPSDYVISPSVDFKVQVQIRTATDHAFAFSGNLVTNFYVRNLVTLALVGAGPYLGDPPAMMAAPAGDHGQDDPNDVVTWYSIDSALIQALPAGNMDAYEILVVGVDMATGAFFVHKDTVILVP
jgi:hypothetical protein